MCEHFLYSMTLYLLLVHSAAFVRVWIKFINLTIQMAHIRGLITFIIMISPQKTWHHSWHSGMPICGSFAWKHKDPTTSFLIICPDLSICSLHSSYTIWATTYFRFMYMRSHMVENVLQTKESDMVNKQNDNGIWWSWTVLVWIQALKKQAEIVLEKPSWF